MLHSRILAYLKGIAQVFHALGSVEGGLRLGATDAFERPEQREMELGRKNFRQELRLIVAAFALARGVERDWNERVDGNGRHAWVIERVGQPPGERTTQVLALVVFEIVNQVADEAPGMARRDGAGEMHGTILAICTLKFRVDRAVEWMRAALAKRRLHPSRKPNTFRAKPAGFEPALATGAERRDEQICRRLRPAL
jgi:hypothetical protein